jgi:spore maturation protein SpmA
LLNGIWLGLMLASVLCAAFTGSMEAVKTGALDAARGAVDLVIGLVGAMALFLGLMRVAQEGGLLAAIARALRPILRWLFPDVPTDHPAMGAMIMNLASNVLGLGNAATPFGLKAMAELEKLNRTPGVASDSMVLFLAINASSVAVLPLGVIAVRASLGSTRPDAIWAPTLIATTASTLAAVGACLLLARLPLFRVRSGSAAGDGGAEAPVGAADDAEATVEAPARGGPVTPLARLVILGFLAAVAVALVLHLHTALASASAWEVAKDLLSSWFLPLFMVSLLLIGLAGGVPVYEAAVEGAKEGLDVAVRILPYLILILVALAMFRASGAMELLTRIVRPVTDAIGIPAEALPMAILRPLSGSGAYGVMVEIMQTHGPDSFVGMLVSSLQGSTETTFYVLTIYLGAARIRDGRHALASCLVGDVAGLLGATAACHWIFG